jgi:putative spermidine/putrescine transport system substrate-binding protein
MGFNPDRIKNKPTSWSDLWRPEFLNKLAFFAPAHSQTPAFIITAAEMFGGSADKPDIAFQKLSELRPTRLGFTWTDWAAAFKAGDVTIATEADFYMNVMKKQGYPIEWVVPKEKGFATLQAASMVKGTKVPELAGAFLNLLLDAKTQHVFAAELLQGTSNKTVVLTPQQTANCTCGAELDQLRFFDPVQIANVRPAWSERVNTEVVPSWGKR